MDACTESATQHAEKFTFRADGHELKTLEQQKQGAGEGKGAHDSGVLIEQDTSDHKHGKKESLFLSPSLADVPHSNLVSDEGYKSPVLVEESKPFVDPYSIIQVRDAVEHLESDTSDLGMHYIASSQNAFMPAANVFESTSSSSETTSADVSEEVEERPSPGSFDDDTIEHDSTMTDDHSISTPQNVPSAAESFEEDQSIDESGKNSGPASSTFTLPSLSEDECLEQKRGKKRAQEEIEETAHWNPHLNLLFEVDSARESDESEMIVVPQRLRTKVTLRRPFYPVWLHEAFHLSEDAFLPRPTREDLELLREAIKGSEPSFPVLRAFFINIFGNVWCNGREIQMVETMQAIQHDTRAASQASFDEKPRLCAAGRQLLAEDRFTFRYLSCFSSYRAFQTSLSLLREATSTKIFCEFRQRLANWAGSRSRDGYDYWALARRMLIEEEGEIILKPEDLSVEDRQAWISQLSQCESLEDAEEVTEEVFGPLTPVQGFPTPKVDLRKFWDRCECGICVRAKKRARVSNENE